MNHILEVVCPSCQAVNRVPAARMQNRPVCGKCRSALFSGRPLEVDQAAFTRHLQRNRIPVLVDFWAPWCGPCKMMAPVFEQAAQRLEPGVRLLKVNTEQQPALASELGIRSIPTLVLFDQNREVARQPGALQLPMLLQWVEAQLGGR